MSYPTDRLILFDRSMGVLPEIAPSEVLSRVRTEEINGEHSLVLVTSRRLEEGWRMLTVDGTGKWREWVVTEIDEEHALGKRATGTYHMVWSLQYDLTTSYSHTHAEIGYGSSPATAPLVAEVILQGVVGWQVGPCDAANVPSGKGAVMIYESAWSRLSKAVEVMGCEVDSIIEVSNLFGVTARKLCLKAHIGSEEVTRRFDWKHDVTNIKRTPDPGPYYCRVVPLGKGETEYADDDETTFEWPLDITEETGTEQNPGPYYIEDAEAAAVFRRSDGNGGWIYPAIAVSYSEDDPELLLNAALDDLHNHTRPNVTYEADVVQLGEAGMDAYGVSIGDDVHIVDYGFNEDVGLRLQGRVIKMEVDELSPDADTKLTIGQLRDGMLDMFKALDARMDDLLSQNSSIYQSLASLTTARYIDELLDRINAEINATGGYAYLVPSEGIITYDTAVADPLVGSEASQVVQIKGGSIRIANTKNSGFAGIDDWDWRTVFVSGHILSDLVTAVKVTSGYIGNATNSNYWNLDTGEMVLRLFYSIYNGTQGTSGDNLFTKNGYVTSTDVNDVNMLLGTSLATSGTRYVPGFKVARHETPTQANPEGNELTYIMLLPFGVDSSTSGAKATNGIVSKHSLNIWGAWEDTAGRSKLNLAPNAAALCIGSTYQTTQTGYNDYYPQISINQSRILLKPYLATGTNKGNQSVYHEISDKHYVKGSLSINGDVVFTNSTFTLGNNLTYSDSSRSLSIADKSNAYYTSDYSSISAGRFIARLSVTTENLTANGSVSSGVKSRLVDTDDYGEKLLYCYEMPTPMFGDIGSGTIGDDGLCYVMIDDVFAETARTDHHYQVFLQKCGEGDLWVSEKTSRYFVVQGTPSLPFDWEVKTHQVGLENLRLESMSTYEEEREAARASKSAGDYVESLYEDVGLIATGEADEVEALYDDVIGQYEHIYDEELAAA